LSRRKSKSSQKVSEVSPVDGLTVRGERFMDTCFSLLWKNEGVVDDESGDGE